jgi:hypothetical protein
MPVKWKPADFDVAVLQPSRIKIKKGQIKVIGDLFRRSI